MNVTLTLEGLRFRAYHGVAEQERTVGADFVVDVTLDVQDATGAVEGDDLAATVDYAAAAAAVSAEMRVPSRLLEHVAGRIARRLLADFPQVRRATVHVVKCNPPMGLSCYGAGATVTLSR